MNHSVRRSPINSQQSINPTWKSACRYNRGSHRVKCALTSNEIRDLCWRPSSRSLVVRWRHYSVDIVSYTPHRCCICSSWWWNSIGNVGRADSRWCQRCIYIIEWLQPNWTQWCESLARERGNRVIAASIHEQCLWRLSVTQYGRQSIRI